MIIDKHKYSSYSIGFDRKRKLSVGNGFGKNCIVFGVDMNSSVHVNDKKKDILIFDEGPMQRLDDTTSLTAEKSYLINFSENNKKFYLELDCNGANSYLFVNSTEIIKFKAKYSDILATPLCLGNISKNLFVNNMKKTWLNGSLMKKNNIM